MEELSVNLDKGAKDHFTNMAFEPRPKGVTAKLSLSLLILHISQPFSSCDHDLTLVLILQPPWDMAKESIFSLLF